MDDDSQLSDWLDDGGLPLDAASSSQAPRTLLVHAALADYFESAESREARILRVLDKFAADTIDDAPEPMIKRRLNRRSLFAVGSAALVLGTLSLLVALPKRNVVAEVNRAFALAMNGDARHFDATITRQRLLDLDSIERRCDLYVSSNNQYVLIVENPLVSPAIVGCNSDRRWLIFGDRIWTSDEQPQLLENPIIDRITAQQLQLTQMLSNLPTRYALDFVASDQMPSQWAPADDRDVICIVGRLTAQDCLGQLPEVTALWIDAATGQTLRMEQIWLTPSTFGLEKIVAVYRDTQPQPADFFTLEHHLANLSDQEQSPR